MAAVQRPSISKRERFRLITGAGPLFKFRVGGKVQGVGFRQATAREARRLQLRGWVKNLADGSVEGVATGSEPGLDALKKWLAQGPPSARVDVLEWLEIESLPTSGEFEIHT